MQDSIDSSSFTIATAMLADYAKVEQSGLLSIVGGGLTRVNTGELPVPFSFFVVLQLAKAAATKVKSPLTVEVRRPSGEVALSVDGEFESGLGDHVVNAAFGLTTIVDVEGVWTISVRFGDTASTELTVTVSERPAGAL